MTSKARIIISCTAVFAVMVIELYALSKGINGLVLKTSFAVIGGITGYNIKVSSEKGGK